MNQADMSEQVVLAVKVSDINHLNELHQASGIDNRSNVTLNEIAKQAALNKKPEVLEWCYAKGWEPPAKSLNDDFFIMAISGASPAIFQVLINHGFDLNAHESEACGDALASAVMSGNDQIDFARWLLEHGHRSTPHDPIHGPSAITSAIRGETASIQMLKLLLDHGHTLKETGAGIAAADEGNLEALKLLLDRGIDPEDREMWWYPFDDDNDEPYDSQGTALYRACRQGQLEPVKLLLDRGADPRAKDNGGTYCLDIAKRRAHRDIVKLLEDKLGIE